MVITTATVCEGVLFSGQLAQSCDGGTVMVGGTGAGTDIGQSVLSPRLKVVTESPSLLWEFL